MTDPTKPRALLSLDGVTIRVWERLVLPDTNWRILQGEQWAVLGPNASGKTALVRAIVGQLPCAAGQIQRNVGRRGYDGIGYVSFELYGQLLAREMSRDPSRFASGHETDFATAGQTILEGAGPAPAGEQAPAGGPVPAGELARVARLLGIEELLHRPMRFLSNGETRKVLIARALMRRPELLILDEPFDGLDEAARARLESVLRTLVAEGVHLVLVTHRDEEIIPEISHVLCLKDCRVVRQGERQSVLTPAALEKLYGRTDSDPSGNGRTGRHPVGQGRDDSGPSGARGGEPLVELRNVTVRYGDTVALRSLTWTMRRGEHWAVLGPNGSGKTTLISLIYADNLQAYTNDIRLFGRRRGTGESIWEIKRRIGQVSPHLQAGYRLDLPVFDVVASGFFDSVGLYRRPTQAQRESAREWIERLGIGELAERAFSQLSYGERRLVIMVRALVKSPEILALDEPCQGLDPANRRRVIALVDRIGFETPTAILYVTHRQDEMPRCITHTLRLRPNSLAPRPNLHENGG
ncbi:MAG: ATP-binding cassette domain-containing protein [Spirochaetales bacterium]|nr:ATP-binding cassette domain-containing protein [Spirochaetales bacterium]